MEAPDILSSFSESLVAPPPGNVVSKGSVAKFLCQSLWTFWRETIVWFLPTLSATSRLASVAVTLLAQGLLPAQPTNQVTNYWRWTKVQPSQPNLGQCQRASVAPDLHVKSAEAAVVPEAVPLPLPHPASVLFLPQVFIPRTLLNKHPACETQPGSLVPREPSPKQEDSTCQVFRIYLSQSLEPSAWDAIISFIANEKTKTI